MIGPISGFHANEQQPHLPEQEIVLIELQPRPRWPRYLPLLVLVGFLGAAAGAVFYSGQVGFREITKSFDYRNSCGRSFSTWGTVNVAYFEAPGLHEIDGDRRGYWLNVGITGEIAVFYDPKKASAPALGQYLQVRGILKCDDPFITESVSMQEQYRRAQ